MENIAEPLRKVALGVFEEMEKLKQQEFTATVTQLHRENEGVLGSGDGGGGREGGREQEALQNEEKDDKNDADVEKGEEFGREKEGERENNSANILLLDEVATGKAQVQPSNVQETKDVNGGKLEDVTPAHSSFNFQSHKLDHNIKSTTTANTLSTGAHPLGGLSPISSQELPAPPQSLGKETARTNTVLHHAPLAKDKAA